MDRRERVARASLAIANATATENDEKSVYSWEDDEDREHALVLADAMIEFWAALTSPEPA